MSRIHTAPASDLLRGHTLLDGRWTCLFCEASFEEGLVFPDPDPDPPTLRRPRKPHSTMWTTSTAAHSRP